MSSIVVCGGGVIGLATALMLGRDGHDVRLLEDDEEAPPASTASAWSDWVRKGVPQFRQPHNLFPRFQQIVGTELPDITQRLLDGGCVWLDLLQSLPPTITDRQPRDGDDRFRTLTGRRPVVEAAFARAADAEPGVQVLRGTRATGYLTGPAVAPGAVHVTGVRTAKGEELRADLVIDAMGRRTPSVEWLSELGARAPDVSSQECGFVYYTRYYRGPVLPAPIGPALAALGSFSLLTIPGDSGTWSVTLFAASSDAPLKAVRDAEVFSRVVDACPIHRHWLDGEVISDVLPMAGVLDRYRRYVVKGAPVVTGLLPVGDAWACTNPSAGRGLSVGLVHAQLLRDTVRAHDGDAGALAVAWDEATERVVAPFFVNQRRADRARIGEMDAAREGRPAPSPDPAAAALLSAAMHDGDVFRALIETVACLALPEDVLARPEIAAKVANLGGLGSDALPGPDRRQLMALVVA